MGLQHGVLKRPKAKLPTPRWGGGGHESAEKGGKAATAGSSECNTDRAWGTWAIRFFSHILLLLSFVFHMNSAEPKPMSDKVRMLTVMKSLLGEWHEFNCAQD
jgi:hypothetical protein